MITKPNGLIYVTHREFKALLDLYHNANEAFQALAPAYREAFWNALYNPSLRLPDEP